MEETEATRLCPNPCLDCGGVATVPGPFGADLCEPCWGQQRTQAILDRARAVLGGEA